MAERFDIISILEQLDKIDAQEALISPQLKSFKANVVNWKLRLKMTKNELRKDYETEGEYLHLEGGLDEYVRYIPWILRQVESMVNRLSRLMDLLEAERAQCYTSMEKAHKKLTKPQIHAGRREFKYRQVQLKIRTLQKDNPTMTLAQAIDTVAIDLEMDNEAVKSAFYYAGRH